MRSRRYPKVHGSLPLKTWRGSTDQFGDEADIAYVAFTRAMRDLYLPRPEKAHFGVKKAAIGLIWGSFFMTSHTISICCLIGDPGRAGRFDTFFKLQLCLTQACDDVDALGAYFFGRH